MCFFDKTNNSMIVRNYATLDYNRDVNNVLKFFSILVNFLRFNVFFISWTFFIIKKRWYKSNSK